MNQPTREHGSSQADSTASIQPSSLPVAGIRLSSGHLLLWMTMTAVVLGYLVQYPLSEPNLSNTDQSLVNLN